ncbi:MAG: hypothetical protein CMO04_01100 [Thalassospira sp.]|nr:hypothetical protein [Thalassospira sp.]
MTMADVTAAIRHCNKVYGSNLSTNNVANFMKDIVRGRGASSNWPESVASLRYTAVQRTGRDKRVFEFIPYSEGQVEPFPDIYLPGPQTEEFPLQSISMTLASKSLGRQDEPWLIQTAVNLRVIETHFAVASQIDMRQLTHLQMSVKLRNTEIDALFLGVVGDESVEAIVTCEAKQYKERILEHQIVEQVKSAFDQTDKDLVIPIGLRAVRHVGFYVAEFQAVSRDELDMFEELTLARDAVYRLSPPVPGV